MNGKYSSVSKAADEESALNGRNDPVPTVLKLHTEKIRLFAYLSFWGMCLFAVLVTKATVAKTLGPCPEHEGDDPTYGMHCSVLMDTFGFNNICVNWDYSPARELTAMVYPIFEYSLILYIVLEFIQIKNDYDNNIASGTVKTLESILFWVKIVLIAWFRMIFVCSVFGEPIQLFGKTIEPVVAHTLGFFGMQFGLILIAFENVAYLFYRGIPMWWMSIQTTKIAAIAYLIVLAVVTLLKISWASSIFIWGTPWISQPWPHIFDRVWMLLAAVLPLFFAANGIKKEPQMVISISNTYAREKNTI